MHSAIIGVGAGLGKSIAYRFAQEGHHVSLVARSAGAAAAMADDLRQAGLSAAGYTGDASDTLEMEGAFRTMREEHGEIDNLIFNVASIKPDRFVTDTETRQLPYGERWQTRGAAVTVDEFIESLRVNVGAALVCVKQVADSMRERRQGTILVTGGTLGIAPWIEWGSLAAGKAALRSFTRSIHKELRDFNVHAALVTIHGTIVPGTQYDPDVIAQYYRDISVSAEDSWTDEYDFNPNSAEAKDPDLQVRK